MILLKADLTLRKTVSSPIDFLNRLEQYKALYSNLHAIKSKTYPLKDYLKIVYGDGIDFDNKVLAPDVVGSNAFDYLENNRDFFKDWVVLGDFSLVTDRSDLIDSPKSVRGSFYTSSNNITNLKGIPLDSSSYRIKGFSEQQIQDYVNNAKYRQQVKQHMDQPDDDLTQSMDDLFANL